MSSLDVVLSQRGIDLDRLELDESGTVVPPQASLPEGASTFVDELPVLCRGTRPDERQIVIGEVLGEGGMGEVRLGEQVALRRPVAVKLLHPDATSLSATVQLLREARVTGLLEHPNVVPIHALGRDPAGRPHIVMKRIEGHAWSRSLGERPASASDENLVHHLEVLLQVIRAADFAHSRGILHLDIKPDNVMIGSFGEVYLVDWGVAVRLHPDAGHPDVPLARDVEHIIGTPHYMAPELVAAEGEQLSERTDVYLLGACLHQILTGEPPHEGVNLRAVLNHAFASQPAAYDERWPRELVSIAHRAMHALPRERYPNGAALGDALQTFLQHRIGRRLAEQARERLRHLEAAIDAVPAEGPDADARRAISDTFAACRFGYDLALREWRENHRALRGMQRCLERMIDFELRHGSASVAATYASELPKANEGLVARVRAGMLRDEAKGVALERLRRDADVTVGDRLRGVVALASGLLWGATHFVLGGLARAAPLRPSVLVGVGAAFVAGATLVTVLGRRVFLDTAANTRAAVAFITGFAAYVAVWLIAWRLALPAPAALSLHLVCAATLWTSLALGSDRRLLPLPAAQASTAFAIMFLPEYAFELIGAGALIGPMAVALMWLGSRRP